MYGFFKNAFRVQNDLRSVRNISTKHERLIHQQQDRQANRLYDMVIVNNHGLMFNAGQLNRLRIGNLLIAIGFVPLLVVANKIIDYRVELQLFLDVNPISLWTGLVLQNRNGVI
jgi:hypothetical protein